MIHICTFFLPGEISYTANLKKNQARAINDEPLHDNQKAFSFVVRVLVNVDDLHNMITQ